MYKVIFLVLFILTFLITGGMSAYYIVKIDEVEHKDDLDTSIDTLKENLATVKAEVDSIKKDIIEFNHVAGAPFVPDGSVVNYHEEQPDNYVFDYNLAELAELLNDIDVNLSWFQKHFEEKNVKLELLLEGELTGVEAVKKVFKDPVTDKGLIDFITELEVKINELTERNRIFQDETIPNLLTELKDLISRYRESENAAKERLGGAYKQGTPISDYLSLVDQYLRRTKEVRSQLLIIQEEVWTRKRELERLKLEAKDEKFALEKELDRLQRRVQLIQHRREEKIERKIPAGMIDRVFDDEIVRVNLGRKHRLFKDTKFRVFKIEKGGIKTDLGEIQVFRIFDDYSFAKVTSVRSGKGIEKGSAVYSYYYEKEQPNHIVIAGNVSSYSKKEIEMKLREIGDVLQANVDEKTNICVVGNNYEDDYLFLKARDEGIKIIRERLFLEYLGFFQYE